MAPAVSIVIPTYDRLDYLKEAVASVIAQTLSDWQLIVVDDGSTDGTVPWLESLQDARVIIVRHRHTGNRSMLRNDGIAHAQAPWIAFLDSDDLWEPDKLAIQLAQLEAHPTRRWSCTGIRFIDEHGAPISQRAGAAYRAKSGWILEDLLTFDAAVTMPTLMVHRSLLDEIGGFDETFIFREDYEVESRLAAHSEIHALPDTLTIVRHHPARTSSNQRVAALHRGTELVYRKVARSTTNEKIRGICRRQCAAQLVQRARALSNEGEHGAAFAASLQAIRETPFAVGVWRSAAGSILRRIGWR